MLSTEHDFECGNIRKSQDAAFTVKPLHGTLSSMLHQITKHKPLYTSRRSQTSETFKILRYAAGVSVINCTEYSLNVSWFPLSLCQKKAKIWVCKKRKFLPCLNIKIIYEHSCFLGQLFQSLLVQQQCWPGRADYEWSMCLFAIKVPAQIWTLSPYSLMQIITAVQGTCP